LAKNVNRLFEAAGAGEVASLNNFSFKAMKRPEAAYRWQYMTEDALARSAAGGWPTPARYRFVLIRDWVTLPPLPSITVKSSFLPRLA
jgi:hypothetical protein